MENITFEHALRNTLNVSVHKSGHDRVCGERRSFHGHQVIHHRPVLGVESKNDHIYFALLERPEDAEQFNALMSEAKLRHWFPSPISFRPCEHDLNLMSNQPGLRDIDIEVQEGDDHATKVHKNAGDYMNQSVVYFALDPNNPRDSVDALRSLAKNSSPDFELPPK